MRAPLAIALVVVAMSLPGISPAAPPVLLTPEQAAIEKVATALSKDPVIRAARANVIKRYEASPPGQIEDGRKTLHGATDELVFGVLLAAASDPARPAPIWTEVMPRRDGARVIPGSRYAGDSPDRAYRGVTIDPSYRYVIRGKTGATPPLYISMEAIPAPAFWGLPPKMVITSKDIDVAADGTFVVSVDATPADGRRNHLQTPPGSEMLLLRDTIPDWGRQSANTLSVRRVDDAPATPLDRAAIVARAVALLDQSATASLKYYEGIWKRQPNALDVFVRDLGWGLLCVNRFSLRDDEALLVTLDPVSAEYLSYQVMDLWLRTPDYDRRTLSLNTRQSTPNPDGTYTYVLSPRDPGIHNWVDTGGLHDGIMVVRWELLKQQAAEATAVREVRKLTLAELPAALPAHVVRVTPEERRQQLARRQADYATRVH